MLRRLLGWLLGPHYAPAERVAIRRRLGIPTVGARRLTPAAPPAQEALTPMREQGYGTDGYGVAGG